MLNYYAEHKDHSSHMLLIVHFSFVHTCFCLGNIAFPEYLKAAGLNCQIWASLIISKI